MPSNPVNFANTTTQTTINSSPGSGTISGFTLSSAAIYVLIQNIGDVDVLLFFGGQSSVSNVSGFLLKPGASIEFANVIPLGNVGYQFLSTGTTARLTYMIANA